jgi:molybdopterin synthase catalytic subunit
MFRIQKQPIDARELEASVRSDACGGIVTFLGVVRERANDGRDVHGLEYEAHEDMALAEFEKIAGEVRERFAEARVGIVHRIGALEIGEIAVAVCAAAPHRGVAFDACEYTIDELKARVPIWKKERYTDGSGEWVANAC